jgi:glucosylceramidase
MFWNFVLTSDGKPVKGNSAVCFGLISLDYDEEAKEWNYKKNAAYYSLAHFSRFAFTVDGKAPQRLETKSSNEGKVIATAFYRADSRIVVVAHNIDDITTETVDFVFGGKKVTYTIAPQSVITLIA